MWTRVSTGQEGGREGSNGTRGGEHPEQRSLSDFGEGGDRLPRGADGGGPAAAEAELS